MLNVGVQSFPIPPQVPQPGSAKKIWLAALLPLGGILLMLVLLSLSSNRFNENLFTLSIVLQCLLTLGCWIYFSIELKKRIIGNSAIILIILYPIIQVGLQIVLFFCGCLALFSVGGIR